MLDDRKLVAASPSQSVPDRRWRVRDNLPGTPAFCPVVCKTSDTEKAFTIDIRSLLNDLALEFGEDVLMRSAVWMNLRESKLSLVIPWQTVTAGCIVSSSTMHYAVMVW